MKAAYFNPYNLSNTIEDVNEVKNYLNKDVSFWKVGNGASSIEIEDKSLIFFKIKEGIYLENLPSGKSPNISPNQETKVLTHYVGGEPMKIPSNCLCDEETAFKIIKYFIEKDGKLHPDYNWIDIYELIPDEFE